jgi:hypothetical protein
MILAMLTMLLAQAMAEPPAHAGFYRSATMEVGAALELEPDGTFAYALDYGAVSETAEGRWSAAADRVLLTATKMDGAWREQSFKDTPLTLDGDALLLQRYGVTIRFVREGEPALPARPNRKLEQGK